MQPVMASPLISPRLGSSSLRKGHYLLRGGRFCLKLCNTAKRGSLCQRSHPHSPRLRSAPHMLHSPLHPSWQRGFMGMLSHTCSSTISLTSIPSSGIKLTSMSSCNSSLSSSLGASFIRIKHSSKSHSIGRVNSFRQRAQRSDSAVLICPVTSMPLGCAGKKASLSSPRRAPPPAPPLHMAPQDKEEATHRELFPFPLEGYLPILLSSERWELPFAKSSVGKR